MSFCHKHWFSDPNIFATQRCRPEMFQTINCVKSNNLSLKYWIFAPSGFKEIGITKFEFVAKTQFLSPSNPRI